ncbi:hypothetical protein FM107_20545 [Sphingobacterium sp. JB170]|nr:hypothetical protein FM107_20545 [Sphingobacterium sp. JB170]
MIPTVIYGYAFLYMYTGYDKLINVERFIQGNAKIPFIGQFAEITGWGIPILEVILALLLIIPFKKTQQWALLVSTILMGFFTVYVALILAFVESKPCNCGGVIESMGWEAHLIFNILWLAAGIYALRKSNKLQILKINKS